MKRNLIYQYLYLSFIAIIFSCNSGSSTKIKEVNLNNLNGDEVKLFTNTVAQSTVFFFLSPECPFCINYTKTISELMDKPFSQKLIFYGVYPGTTYSAEDIKSFQEEYNFHITALLDENNKLVKMLGAIVTPQCIILNEKSEIIYSGAIDNWAYDTGRKRRVTTEHYVDDALSNIANGKLPAPAETEPIGCFIEL